MPAEPEGPRGSGLREKTEGQVLGGWGRGPRPWSGDLPDLRPRERDRGSC